MERNEDQAPRRRGARPPRLALAAVLLAQSPEDAERFGFSGFELYDFAAPVHSLVAGDVDGDGLGDLALVNGARARLEIFLRLPPDAPDALPEPEGRVRPNAVRHDGRFAVRRVPEERRIQALAAGDVDGDGRAELVYACEGGEVVLVDGLEGEPRRTRRRLDELRGGCSALELADLDDDGRAEVLLVGDDTLHRLDGALAGAPVVLDHLAAGMDRLFLADLDGDGPRELVYAYLSEERPLRVRDGLGGRRFGPRFEPDLARVRSVAVADLDGDGASEALVVFQLSGRLAVLAREPATGERAPLLARTSFEDVGKDPRRSFAVGDLTGDGAADVVVAEPETARVVLYLASRDTRVLRAVPSPSLVDVDQPRIGDVDGDGVPELVVASTTERLLGIARAGEDGRVDFPRTLAVDGEPRALELADLDGDGAAELCAVATSGEGRSRRSSLQVWRSAGASFEALEAVPLEGLRKEPTALRAADLDGDGRMDLVLFVGGADELPLFLVQRPDGTFAPEERDRDAPGLGALAGAGPERLSTADLDGDGRAECLVAARNFARALTFPRVHEGVFEPDVSVQFNGPAADSRIGAAVALDWDGDGRLEVALRDERTREVLVLARDEDGPRELTRVDAGRLDFRELHAADVDGDGREDLVLLGTRELGVAFAGTAARSWRERAVYEPPSGAATLDAVVAADLDGDGGREVVATELSRHALVLLAAREASLAHALEFRVFEDSGMTDGELEREPRELVTTDFDGNGRADLAVLVHDKLIVYLQE